MKHSEFKASIDQVISFMEVEKILEQVRLTTSTKKKLEILNNNKDNTLLAKVLEYTYNPYKRYGVSEKMVLQGSYEGIPTEKDVFKMLDKLANNNINDDLRMELADFLGYYDAIAILLRQMVNKDLKLGCNINTINKVWNGLVPTSETGVEIKPMLASKFDFDKPPKGEFAVTEKLDGIRCIAICKKDGVQLYTRQGKLIEGCVEVEQCLSIIQHSYNKEFVLDGELLAEGCTYENVYKETTKRVKNKNEFKKGINFVAFDILDIVEFENMKCTTPYYERLATLMNLHKNVITKVSPINMKNVVDIIMPLYIGDDLNRILELLEEYRLKGAEGLMANVLNAPYEFKRSKSILKVKVMQTADLKIVGFEEGQGRNEGKLGALLVEYKNNIVGVGSGFSDHEREFIWNNQHMYLDKICEIQFFEESKNKDGALSLRFPVWKHLRLDKTEPSYF